MWLGKHILGEREEKVQQLSAKNVWWEIFIIDISKKYRYVL